MEFTSENIEKIDEVASHLYFRAAHTTIGKWLDNFEEQDRENALQLLGFFNFFTTDRIYASLKHSLEEIIQDTPWCGKIKIIGIRNKKKESEGIFGRQSGQMISYYAGKVAKMVDEDKIKVISEEELTRLYQKHPRKAYKIVLIDDIFGTGDTFIDYYNDIRRIISSHWTVAALSIAYTPEAATRLKNDLNIDVYGERIIPIFDAIRDADYIGRTKFLEYKQLARKYGAKLYKPGEGNITPLGYKDSQTLVGFEYGVPNNTLPIIWSSKKENADGIDWFPIFARNISDRLDRRRRCHEDIKRWYLAARKGGLRFKKSGGEVKTLNTEIVRMCLILIMIDKHKDKTIITNYLCINEGDYEDSIKQAKENAFLDDTCTLTEKAKTALNEINKRSNNEEEIDVLTIYLPDD